jgi:hypothetical protein
MGDIWLFSQLAPPMTTATTVRALLHTPVQGRKRRQQ